MFGTVMDVIDRYLPDPVRHAQMRALLAFLSVNSTFRGPVHAGQRACAWPSRWPRRATTRPCRRCGAASAPCPTTSATCSRRSGGELRRHARVARILVADGRVGGVELSDGETITAPVVVSNLDATKTFTELIDRDLLPERVRPAGRRHRPPGRLLPDALRPQRAARADRPERGAQRGRSCARRSACSARPRRCSATTRPACGARCPTRRRCRWASRRCSTRRSPPRASTRPAPSRSTRRSAPATRTRCACATRWPSGSWRGSPPSPRTSPTSIERQISYPAYSYELMFGCTGGDFTHALLHPELMGPFRPGPRGLARQRGARSTGLYLCGAGCHGGPGRHLHPRLQRGLRRARRRRIGSADG